MLNESLELMIERHALLLAARRCRDEADRRRIEAQHEEDAYIEMMRRVRAIERHLDQSKTEEAPNVDV